MRLLRLGLVLSCSALLFGCPSVSNLTSARTLDEGQLQFVVSPTFSGVGATGPEGTTVPMVPLVEGQFRYGITDHVELGGKLWLGGFAAHMKFGLVRSDEDSGFNLSLDPGLSYAGLTVNNGTVGAIYVYLPLLMGVRFGDGHEFTFGPRLVPVLGGAYVGGESGNANALLAGGSLGMSFKLGGMRLMPEFSLVADTGPTPDAQRAVFSQFSLGFGFGTH